MPMKRVSPSGSIPICCVIPLPPSCLTLVRSPLTKCRSSSGTCICPPPRSMPKLVYGHSARTMYVPWVVARAEFAGRRASPRVERRLGPPPFFITHCILPETAIDLPPVKPIQREPGAQRSEGLQAILGCIEVPPFDLLRNLP